MPPVCIWVLGERQLGGGFGAIAGFLHLLGFVLGFENLDERGPAPSSIVERLRCRRRIWMFGGVLLVHVRFFLRTLGEAFPIAAKFVVEKLEGGQIGPFGAGEFLDDELHVLLVVFRTKMRVAL